MCKYLLIRMRQVAKLQVSMPERCMHAMAYSKPYGDALASGLCF